MTSGMRRSRVDGVVAANMTRHHRGYNHTAKSGTGSTQAAGNSRGPAAG